MVAACSSNSDSISLKDFIVYRFWNFETKVRLFRYYIFIICLKTFRNSGGETSAAVGGDVSHVATVCQIATWDTSPPTWTLQSERIIFTTTSPRLRRNPPPPSLAAYRRVLEGDDRHGRGSRPPWEFAVSKPRVWTAQTQGLLTANSLSARIRRSIIPALISGKNAHKHAEDPYFCMFTPFLLRSGMPFRLRAKRQFSSF